MAVDWAPWTQPKNSKVQFKDKSPSEPNVSVFTKPDNCRNPGACSALVEIERLQTAINEAYRIMCSGKPPHSARETNARRVLRLAGVTVKEQSV